MNIHRLTLYLGKTLITYTGVACLLLLGLDLLFSLVNEFRYLGTGDYHTLNMVAYLLLSAPQKLVKMFPLAALLGTLLGLGSLASHSELIVMRAQGLSILSIIRILLKTGVLLVMMVWVISEVAVPFLDTKAEYLKAVALSGGQALETQQGIWIRDGQDFVHINGVQLDGRLEGVTRYQFNQRLQCERISYAAYGYYHQHHWILYDIQESQFNEALTEVAHAHYPEQKWDSVLSPSILTVVSAKSLEKLSLLGLWKTFQYRQKNHLETQVVELIFWGKIAEPLVTLIMILLAVPCIFGPLRNATMGRRLLAGLSLGFSFYIVTHVFSHLTTAQAFPALLGIFLPIILVFFLAILSIRRLR